MADKKTYFCEKCQKAMIRTNFYTSNNLEKYPDDGVMSLCRKCLTMHVDNWDPDTYVWILKEADVPYLPDEWNKLLAKYGKDKEKLSGTTIIGRYLSKMKLQQYRKYRWADTEHLQEKKKREIENTMKRQGYSAAEIDDVIEKGVFLPPQKIEPPEEKDDNPLQPIGPPEETPFDLGLTDEDVMYLRLKWGKLYKPEEWVILEQLYIDMMNSYDIQSAGDLNTLKLACKSSLKANQLLDIGD